MECDERGMAELAPRRQQNKYVGGQKDLRVIVRHGGGMMR